MRVAFGTPLNRLGWLHEELFFLTSATPISLQFSLADVPTSVFPVARGRPIGQPSHHKLGKSKILSRNTALRESLRLLKGHLCPADERSIQQFLSRILGVDRPKINLTPDRVRGSQKLYVLDRHGSGVCRSPSLYLLPFQGTANTLGVPTSWTPEGSHRGFSTNPSQFGPPNKLSVLPGSSTHSMFGMNYCGTGTPPPSGPGDSLWVTKMGYPEGDKKIVPLNAAKELLGS